jgi:hypothetical protein
MSDVTMSAEMAVYRQSLRDITAHANFLILKQKIGLLARSNGAVL